MASKKWIVLPGGRIKRWKRARTDVRQLVPPHWYRNRLNRRERRRSWRAVFRGDAHAYPYVHPREANWYW
jgi:hypothetical protein